MGWGWVWDVETGLRVVSAGVRLYLLSIVRLLSFGPSRVVVVASTELALSAIPRDSLICTRSSGIISGPVVILISPYRTYGKVLQQEVLQLYV